LIVGERLRQARVIRGLTQTNLAKRVGVKQPAIAQFENGSRDPSRETLAAIAFATGFPPAFFSKPVRTHFPMGSLLFRGKARMTERQRGQSHELASLLFEAFETLASNVNTLPITVPMLTNRDPSKAAQLTRSALGLSPNGPLKNLVYNLEMAGAAVIALPVDLPNRDAFSVWTSSGVPVIVLSHDRPGDRQRWSAAHELGHLVMHRQVVERGKTLEDEADAFAAELLLPKSSIREEFGKRRVTLQALSPLKPKWGVSISALEMRAHRLRILSDRQHRDLQKQITHYGWRKQEPNALAVPVEKPRAFRKMAELLCGIPIDEQRLASILSLTPSMASEILSEHRAQDANPAPKGRVLYLN
jgi:Zn-dependent peptidase ImmA (M78 family)/DNA-binding XRE family transcriptional regulator